MKKLIFFFTLILFACSDSYTIEGTITRVIDGDTFVFQGPKGKFKVRLADIDAPEISQTFGLRSKNYLERYLNKHVKLYCHGKDKYKRVLATIYVNDENLNEIMIKQGFAWVFMSKNPRLKQLQFDAKANNLGLWQYDYTEPWIYRKEYKY